jgi:hypothetical protein
MAPSGSEHPTNRQNGRSTSASGWPERAAQVRTRRTAPPDQSAADPSSLPASRLPDRMNQRTPCASTGEFFNTIRQKRPFIGRRIARYAFVRFRRGKRIFESIGPEQFTTASQTRLIASTLVSGLFDRALEHPVQSRWLSRPPVAGTWTTTAPIRGFSRSIDTRLRVSPTRRPSIAGELASLIR